MVNNNSYDLHKENFGDPQESLRHIKGSWNPKLWELLLQSLVTHCVPGCPLNCRHWSLTPDLLSKTWSLRICSGSPVHRGGLSLAGAASGRAGQQHAAGQVETQGEGLQTQAQRDLLSQNKFPSSWVLVSCLKFLGGLIKILDSERVSHSGKEDPSEMWSPQNTPNLGEHHVSVQAHAYSRKIYGFLPRLWLVLIPEDSHRCYQFKRENVDKKNLTSVLVADLHLSQEQFLPFNYFLPLRDVVLSKNLTCIKKSPIYHSSRWSFGSLLV